MCLLCLLPTKLLPASFCSRWSLLILHAYTAAQRLWHHPALSGTKHTHGQGQAHPKVAGKDWQDSQKARSTALPARFPKNKDHYTPTKAVCWSLGLGRSTVRYEGNSLRISRITGIFSAQTAAICRILNTLLAEESGALPVHTSGRWNPGNGF